VKLLLIEDSARLRTALQHGLRRAGHTVEAAKDGPEGLALAMAGDQDVIVLDLMLPGMDGLTVLRRLRAQGKTTHVLILSARDLVEDRVQGLRLGADDYLVKPFSFDELQARLEALARRTYHAKNPLLRKGALAIDTAARQAVCDGRAVNLTPREYGLLELLVVRCGEVLSRKELCERLYAVDRQVASNVVDVLIHSLRRKLDPEHPQRFIQTRRGLGYMIEDVP
jgi:two-component system, OmpR family, copper resistance phosphate regulon response regulator CusR